VVTTRKPSSERKASLSEVRSVLRSGRSVLLVFGLGPRGLPKEVFDIGQKHLDVTTKGLSLETCTALGAVIGALLAK
jgi:hypothetical protein